MVSCNEGFDRHMKVGVVVPPPGWSKALGPL